ncbi:hypothetical protein BTW15_29830 [Pseudomonas syringae pv. tomato]|uniref:Uncharacterized protein n=2 Tax=Pseudomonas syringae group genomosp. 3 TaxID=251701 RepID=A0AB36KIJ7_PSEUB|nr:hypothetical protein XJ28_05105 [Pseudomonas syringae pv. tomato]KPW44706.1 hypothetical protein ALO88_102437 [Pseudomonas syringae pv. antirrhini]QBI65145.1 hypothetical protein EIZ61_28820 [Pseudomonas syringae]KGK92162.1 hypothetical protein NB04_28125 [Pseudomonas syringae pv. tomato]OPE56471.1 hypothetical protein BTW15_29830 [Pseudomonas syringae pv. tomato]
MRPKKLVTTGGDKRTQLKRSIGKIGSMTSLPDFDQLNPEQLRAIAGQLMQRIETLDQKVESMVAVTLWQPGPVTVVSSLSV